MQEREVGENINVAAAREAMRIRNQREPVLVCSSHSSPSCPSSLCFRVKDIHRLVGGVERARVVRRMCCHVGAPTLPRLCAH